MRGWGTWIFASVVATGCAADTGSVLVVRVLDAPAEDAAAMSYELFLADLPALSVAGDVLLERLTDADGADLGFVTAAELREGVPIWLESAAPRELQVAVLAGRPEFADLAAFAATTIRVDPDLARRYAVDLEPVDVDDGRHVWSDCPVVSDDQPRVERVSRFGDELGPTCLAWTDGDRTITIGRLGDRDCDGPETTDQPSCSFDPTACDPTVGGFEVDDDGDDRTLNFVIPDCTLCGDPPGPCDCDLNDGARFVGNDNDECDGFDGDCDGIADVPGLLVEDVDPLDFMDIDGVDGLGDDFGGTNGALGYNLVTCEPCFVDGERVACDCEPTLDTVNVGAREACDGVDSNCDGQPDGVDGVFRLPETRCVEPVVGGCVAGVYGCDENGGTPEDRCIQAPLMLAPECKSTTVCKPTPNGTELCETLDGEPRLCTQTFDDLTAAPCDTAPLGVGPLALLPIAGKCDATLYGGVAGDWLLAVTSSSAAVITGNRITNIDCNSVLIVNRGQVRATEPVDVILELKRLPPSQGTLLVPLRFEAFTGECVEERSLHCSADAFDNLP